MLNSEEIHVEYVMNKMTKFSLSFPILLTLHSSIEIPGSV